MISEQCDEQIDAGAAVEPPVENNENPLPFDGEQPEFDEDGNPFFRDTKPDPDPTDPADLKVLNNIDPARHKRNCGRTGPTSIIGRQIASRNAKRHGMCAKTLILENESQEDWDELLTMWLDSYQNPPEKTILYTYVVKAAQAEWFRLRIQREYDLFYASMDSAPLDSWHAEKEKTHQLMTRYRNGANRNAQSEKRMLDQHWKLHGKPAAAPAKPADQPKPAPEPPPQPERIIPKILFVHNETGEMQDAQGNDYPAPPDYKPEPIIPGHYPPDHPTRFHERQQKR